MGFLIMMSNHWLSEVTGTLQLFSSLTYMKVCFPIIVPLVLSMKDGQIPPWLDCAPLILEPNY